MCHNGAMEQGVMGTHQSKYGVPGSTEVMTLELVPKETWNTASLGKTARWGCIPSRRN